MKFFHCFCFEILIIIKASECSEGEMFLFGKKNTSLEDHFIAPHKIQPKQIYCSSQLFQNLFYNFKHKF